MNKNIFFFTLSFIFFLFSCSEEKKSNTIIGLWKPYSKWITDAKYFDEYYDFGSDGSFETKNFKFLYSSSKFFSEKDLKGPETIKLHYKIDQIDSLGGIYYSLIDENDNTLHRRYAIVDYPLLFACGIKPKPKNEKRLYFIEPYYNSIIKNKNDIKIPEYFNMNFIISDTIKDSEFYVFFNREMGKSDIKIKDVNISIDKKGLTKVNRFFDPRYFAMEKYKAFVKKQDGLMEIPILYYRHYPLATLSKEDVERICPNTNSRCLLVGRLNPDRTFLEEESNQELKGGNILFLRYISKDGLLKNYVKNQSDSNN